MRAIYLLVIILACVAVSCEPPPEPLSATAINQTVQAAIAATQTAMLTPSPTTTATATAIPSATFTQTPSPRASATPTITFTPTPTPTWTRTLTPLPTAIRTATTSPLPPRLTTTILGCETGLDITHGLGEVTNAYVLVRNPLNTELTNVCLVLGANDEGKPHPDKSHCFASLRAGYEVTTKLTVDTEFRKLTSIQVAVTTNQGVTDQAIGTECRAIGSAEMSKINPILNVPRPIQ